MLKVKRTLVDKLDTRGLYATHDNGGRPFAVKLIGKQVHVYEVERTDKKDNEYYLIGKVPVRDKSDLMIGIDDAYKFHGNTVLVRLKNNRYLYIGESLFEFSPVDKIEKYYSPVGNSDVPYPYAVGEEFTYLLVEGVYIDNRYLKSFKPKGYDNVPYTYYYGHDIGWGAIRSDGVKPMKRKVIAPRRWNLPDSWQ
jgi:hypothetical protein